MTISKAITLSLMLFATAYAGAQSTSLTQPSFNAFNTSDGLPKFPQQGNIPKQVITVKETKRLPVCGLHMVETSDGKVSLITEGGRFAIYGGRWIDLFESKIITNIADAASLDKINFGRMGMNVDDFSPTMIGNGDKTIVVFIDPIDDVSRSMVRQMPSFANKYTFKLVTLPLKGSQAAKFARAMHCAPNKKFATDAFINNSFKSLPEPSSSCDVSPIQKAMITASVLNIRSTPYFVFPDHTTASVNTVGASLSDVIAQK